MCGTLQKKGTGSCPARYTNSSKLEQVVICKITEHILTYENLKELVYLLNEEMDAAAGEYRERLNVISVEVDNVNQRLERLYDALEQVVCSSLIWRLESSVLDNARSSYIRHGGNWKTCFPIER